VSAWTFESLAGAGRDRLEQALRAGAAPDYGRLEGHLYRGLNLGFVGRLVGPKFKKGFAMKGERPFGYNELCGQDGKGPGGVWELKPGRGHVGHFRVGSVAEEPTRRPYDRYPGAGLFDYGVQLNSGLQLPFRLIRDVVVLPDPDDDDLVLGKAYLDLGLGRIFCCYFVLGHRVPIGA
jgi:hypothetical protein